MEAKAVEQLLSSVTPAEWISFLFDLQNALISYGHLEAVTKKGAEDRAGKFSDLKNFFEELNDIKK